jgi:ABC-type sugar transport system substrate-binding protein
MKTLSLLLLAVTVMLSGCGKSSDQASTGDKKLTIALLPKSKGNAYFISVKNGESREGLGRGAYL